MNEEMIHAESADFDEEFDESDEDNSFGGLWERCECGAVFVGNCDGRFRTEVSVNSIEIMKCSRSEDFEQATPLCFWDSNEGGCDESAWEGKQYCSYHLAIIEFEEGDDK